jgi:predicted membrane channel-forming protein YqfA (hemolysin III family)
MHIEREALIELTKNEQEFRHISQEKQRKANNISYFFGMVFGFIYNIGLLYLIYYFFNQGEKELAIKIFIINAILIFSCFALLSFSRRNSNRKQFKDYKKNYRKNNNHQ